MKLYRICALTEVELHGWSSTHQIPTFYLDAELHGLRTEGEAEVLARTMIKELIAAVAGAAETKVWLSAVEVGDARD
jgi:hypothetical protein